MKIFPLLAAVIPACVGVAQAHPLLIEESAVIPNPDPTLTTCCFEAGLDGDDVIMIGRKEIIDPEPGNFDDTYALAMHFRRSGSTWTYAGPLGDALLDNEADAPNQFGVAMRDGVAALTMIDLRVFERLGGNYVAAQVQHSFGVPTRYLDIDGGNILIGDGTWGGHILRKDSAGVWRPFDYIYAGYSGDGDGANGGPIAISSASAAVLDPYNIDELPSPGLAMFRNVGNNDWQQSQRLVAAAGHTFGEMAISGNVMYVHDDVRYGTARYYRAADNLWRPSGLFLRTDGDHRLISQYLGGSGGRLVIGDNFVLRDAWDYDKQVRVVQVFQYVAPNVLGHVATLSPSDGASIGGHISVSGRTVLVGGLQKAYLFELPTQPRAPALIQQTFDGATAGGWQVVSGNFAVAQGANSRVYRQTSTAGDATAVLQAADWAHQSIQADVTPTAINGANRWVGLATRRSDASNYYYVTLRSTGVIELKRMHQGEFGAIDSASYPFALDRTYRLRLESVGARQRVYVDGALVLEAIDHELSQGHAALLTSRAAADFDNVIVSPADIATLWERGAERVCDRNCSLVEWQTADGDWSWQQEGGNEHFTQASLTTTARAPAGSLTRNLDQVVETRARVRTFGNGSDPWFGVMARYQDINNYVYLSLRRSNTLTLRKLVNGQIVELGAAAVPTTVGAWYRLRLDAVGGRLRAFVNGRQVLEAVDSQPTPGQVGVLTNRTHADFDDFLAVRP